MPIDRYVNFYGLSIAGVEIPLLDIVITETNGNQTKAANIL